MILRVCTDAQMHRCIDLFYNVEFMMMMIKCEILNRRDTSLGTFHKTQL